MNKKIVFFSIVLLFSILCLKAQTQVGSIINGPNGRPAGVVFHYDAETGTGLMVSLVETQLPWGTMDVNITHANDYINSAVARLDFAGLVNTAAIVNQLGTRTEYAARWCFEHNAEGLTGWYLPSVGELNLLIAQRQVVNRALQGINATPLATQWHWSSSEGNENRAWNISGVNIYPANKNEVRRVRAIRKF